MHVGVHQTGRDRSAFEVDDFDGLARAPSGHDAVGDGQVGGDPLTGRRREHSTAAKEQVSGLIATSYGKDMGGRRCAGHVSG
jgi:hypothetical protein